MADDPTPQDPAPELSKDPTPEPKADKTFTQAEVDRIIAGRFQKFADYDDLKQQLDTLQSATATEAEKAAKAAREEGRQAALDEATPRLVLAEFRAAAGGKVSEPLKAYLEDVDPKKFVTDKGEIDTERIAAKVTALAPEPEPNKPPLGGGPRKTEKPETKPGLDRLRSAYADSGTK